MQKIFTFLYDKFTQDNMYQILSQSVRFCSLYIKKHFGVFFSVHSLDGLGSSENTAMTSTTRSWRSMYDK